MKYYALPFHRLQSLVHLEHSELGTHRERKVEFLLPFSEIVDEFRKSFVPSVRSNEFGSERLLGVRIACIPADFDIFCGLIRQLSQFLRIFFR